MNAEPAHSEELESGVQHAIQIASGHFEAAREECRAKGLRDTDLSAAVFGYLMNLLEDQLGERAVPVLVGMVSDLAASAGFGGADAVLDPARAEYSRANPSKRYAELLRHYRQMHEQGYDIKDGAETITLPSEKAFPGNELPKFIVPIKELVTSHGAKTLLDYGAGKGRQYDPGEIRDPDGTTYPDIRGFFGVDSIVCYDPAFSGHDALPEGKFDGVVCTDVLEHCPPQDLPWIIKEIFAFANKFIFANIACYPAKALLPDGENAHCTIRHPEWWNGLFAGTANDFPDVHYLLCFGAPVESASGESELQALWAERQRY